MPNLGPAMSRRALAGTGGQAHLTEQCHESVGLTRSAAVIVAFMTAATVLVGAVIAWGLPQLAAAIATVSEAPIFGIGAEVSS